MALWLLVIVLPGAAQAAGPVSFYDRKSEGWYWYQRDPVEPEVEEIREPPAVATDGQEDEQETVAETPEQPPAPAPAIAATPPAHPSFSPAWFREELPKYRDAAIGDPTPENVRAYLYLQRVAMDKSQKFAQIAQRVTMGDPLLDQNSSRPIASAGGWTQDRVVSKNKTEALGKLAQTTGIWFFYSSDCPYCTMQAPLLKTFQKNHGFAVLPISLDNRPLPGGEFPNFVVDKGQAQAFGVQMTPTLVLQRPPDGFTTLSQGMLSLKELETRVLMAAVREGWLSEDEYGTTRIASTPALALPATPVASNDQALPEDPEKLVDYLRGAVGRF
ncbi:MAG: conjugal transfer protein TraF [Gammaproteobacteria bacterium]